jgi:2'-5' RNA ligase
MNVVRAFIAINLSPEIHQNLEEVVGRLKERLPDAPVRWVAVKNIHLTLKFLGDVSVANLEILTKILRSEASHHAPFEFSVGELGAFPSIRRPRVVWVGVEAPPELRTLQHGIETETQRLGYAREDRDFSPHLTLGRISRNAASRDVQRVSEVVGSYKVGFLGAARVQAIYLYRSDLQPGGAIYTQLFSALLSEPNP